MKSKTKTTTAKAKTATKPEPKATAKPKSQVAMVLDLIRKKVPADKIAAQVNEALKGKCTPGYVRHIGRKAGLLEAVAA